MPDNESSRIIISEQKEYDVIMYALFCLVTDVTANPLTADLAAELITRISGEQCQLPASMVIDLRRRTELSALIARLIHS